MAAGSTDGGQDLSVGSLLRKVTRESRNEVRMLRPRLSLGLLVMRMLPPLTGARTRAAILRLSGVAVGRGTTFGGSLTIAGPLGAKALRIGEGCFVNAGCHFDVSASIDLGDGCALGQEVMILTGTHEVAWPQRRAGALSASPVVVGRGAWLGARVVVLPGVTVGEGSIVGAGAVVTRDVPPNTVVGGVPATALRVIED